MHLAKTPAVLLAAAFLTSGVARADPPEAAPRSVFRIEVSVTGVDENPRAAPATYTVILLENQTGAVSTGTNIPLGPAPSSCRPPRPAPRAARRSSTGCGSTASRP